MAPLDTLLESYRTQAATERDKGTAFEKLIAVWLVTDPVQARRFERVELWSDWTRRQGRDRSDVGIDLVGTLHGGRLAAIQCKFYSPDKRIRKEDIDSFISASAKHEFAERLIVETTEGKWSDNADAMLRDQTLPTNRIGLRDLRESSVNWAAFAATGIIERPKPKKLRHHQQEALEAVLAGLAEADRGKLIMACGTGKTLTGLRIAESLVGKDSQVLLLVPSLALMSQTITEWCADAVFDITAFAVCSDTQVGKRRRTREDIAELQISDLAFPATTDAERFAGKVAESGCGAMRVVFATYQSIAVIAKAQREHGLADFDLIICDEAHRTTGATYAGVEESNFVKVHDNEVIRGNKRLYMTATPRIFGETAKSKARDADVALSSMDDPDQYGDLLYHYGFSRAVESGILSDYRVIVLAMDEGQISTAIQRRLEDGSSQLVLDDATKIVGCWKALSKIGLSEDDSDGNAEPMRRALAFCRSIESSKLVRNEFEQVVKEFQAAVGGDEEQGAYCEVRHVDGTYNARDRGQRLDWLKEDAGKNVCRVLSNARCLTEGVDVPALDAIMFLHPRKSQIDVVQAVGRVMRKTLDKDTGYVILPVGIPPGLAADEALNDNERYRVVWQILNALRAHDERLDAVINQGGLGQDISDRISIVDGRTSLVSEELKAVTATVEDLPARSRGEGSGIGEKPPPDPPPPRTDPLPLVIDEFSRAVMAKIVEKCGTREYWEDWARDVAQIAERHITRISSLVTKPGSEAQQWFDDFLKELQDDLNESVTEKDAIEMLAQHLITRPVFEALFDDSEFVERNPVSKAMSEVLSVIDEAEINREAKSLEGFYASVRRRAVGIADPQARQKLIVELYDKFFRGAFPLTTQRLGIVYTPVEIVDFIIHSVNDVLQDEFGSSLGDEGVHILDPFVGTGTFITRLLQSGLIAREDLERKYREEIHANEIVLLAYYIAAINIETVFHSIAGRNDYLPYNGICLTDTFAMHEGDDELSFYMKDNTDRRERQKATDIRVIIGNPPYSAGQRSENDNAKNAAYARLDQRIRTTYAAKSGTPNLRNLYDSYIRAIRWGSDRLGKSGVMAYVSGSAWIERAFADGLRRCLVEEFATVHVFHLRGDIRKNMLSGGRAGEGQNVFGQGSMTGVAITVFVKNSNAQERGRIFFSDIGDDLGQKSKLDIVRRFGSIRGIEDNCAWTTVLPDNYGDWLDQRDLDFEAYPKIGDKKDKTGRVLFQNYSLGVITKRDAWCINASRSGLTQNIRLTLDFYNKERARWTATEGAVGQARPSIDDFIVPEPKKISWSRALKHNLCKGRRITLEDGQFLQCLHCPFVRRWQFYSRSLNEDVAQMPRIFPNDQLPNKVIAVTGKGGRSGFSALMMDALPNLDTIEKGQCFPFWLYETDDDTEADLLEERFPGYRRLDAITDYGLRHFRSEYPSEKVNREDIFHYIYGLLHSEDYRARFRTNLAKDLPRIPCVKPVEHYRAFRDAGRRLGELHVGYESVDPYPADIDSGGHFLSLMEPETAYRVEKMKFAGSGRNKDKSTVVYNPHITIRNIPPSAWDYIVNGKPALQWIMDRQCVKTDKASGIVSDTNRYAIETVGDPRYPLDLFLRVITVSLETNKIVQSLPELVLE